MYSCWDREIRRFELGRGKHHQLAHLEALLIEKGGGLPLQDAVLG